MKCAAELVRKNKFSADVCKRFGLILFDYVETAFARELCETYAYFRGPGLQEFYTGMEQLICDSVDGMAPDTMRVRDRTGLREAERWEIQVEATADAIFSVRRRLADYDFPDPMLAELEPEIPVVFRTAREKDWARLREGYWNLYGRAAWIMSAASMTLWVLDCAYSTGRPRFSPATVYGRVYLPFAAGARAYAGRFLCGTEAADRRNRAAVQNVAEEIKKRWDIDIGDLKPPFEEKTAD